MLIRLGYDIQFDIPAAVTIVAMLKVHPSRVPYLLTPDTMRIEPQIPAEDYFDSFGNICSRFTAAPGLLRLSSSSLIQDSGLLEHLGYGAQQVPVDQLPHDVLRFLLASRYCEVDSLSNTAVELFGETEPGWPRVQAILNWVHGKVQFGYNFARATKSALDVYTERVGVCRDFQHLAITFCRAMNIPARYATGYLGDIGITLPPSPMDFSAWFEVYLDGRWWTCDARHNVPRIGRVLMATGRDAADVAITTSFGLAALRSFAVVTDEVAEADAGVLAKGTSGTGFAL